MSIEIVLVPLAIAAVSAWNAARAEQDGTGRQVVQVETRMRDAGLLQQALRDTGARVQAESESITAVWQGVEAVFRRDEAGIWHVRMTGDVDEVRAASIARAVDQAYGRRVQQAVIARLRDRAEPAGMRIESERIEEDESITLTLSVGASR
ncbi:hypothetical protein [Intrasporangium calvum]|uniref:Uncharacterized protein n=1 Tax=Intrasporangium calvum (strain ATCC 23552 / DSM 43043 / JCM 3097 / NBRC 12989 / NCIMB 10167 / NRRL B-3866 / 7 KIP) TaxID=710696 RepID=E6SC26_INTC7|nr:hypothetical protein [Intrasporangium calvum]ADU49566.1 hypothetical protein Intca_3080 [Intrasporangium calvum DSM 43043]